MKCSTSTATFLIAVLALLYGPPVVDAQEQQLLRGGGDSIKAGDITNSRKLQALPNGSQKCIAGSPAKHTEVVWGETNTRNAPGGTKCCQSSKDPDRIVRCQVPL